MRTQSLSEFDFDPVNRKRGAHLLENLECESGPMGLNHITVSPPSNHDVCVADVGLFQ